MTDPIFNARKVLHSLTVVYAHQSSGRASRAAPGALRNRALALDALDNLIAAGLEFVEAQAAADADHIGSSRVLDRAGVAQRAFQQALAPFIIE